MSPRERILRLAREILLAHGVDALDGLAEVTIRPVSGGTVVVYTERPGELVREAPELGQLARRLLGLLTPIPVPRKQLAPRLGNPSKSYLHQAVHELTEREPPLAVEDRRGIRLV